MSHVTPPAPPMADDASARVPSNLRNVLRALVALTAILAVLASAWYLRELRKELCHDAELRAEAGARLLEEHVLRTFRATEFIIDRVAALGLSIPIDELATSSKAWDELLTLRSGLPEPGTLWIANAEGRIALGTIAFPAPPIDVTDRYYFHAHLEARRGLVVGPLVATKARSLQAFHLSKRIEGADGRLRGVAIAGFDAPYFTDFHHSLALGPRSALSIVGMDGRVIIRQPDPENWVGRSVGDGPVLTAVATNAKGPLTARSPLDGVERIIAYRSIPSFGVVVICSVAVEDALTGWWRAAATTGIVLAAVFLVLGTLSVFAFRSLRREAGLLASLEETVRERTEEARALAAEARSANETKTRFLAAASHDLRQPLQAAGMFVEVLSGRMAGSPDQPIIDKLRQSVDATQALLSTLLDASTLEAGRVEATPVVFPLATMMATLVDQMEPDAVRRGLSLHMVPTDAWVVSDPVLLERMLRNLMVNALRYTEKGGVLLGCRRRGDRVAIQVVDTGCGIPVDHQASVFDDFTRLGDKGAGPSRGLGLGLAVVRRMAALMGHDLELRSVVGKGSVFGVVVPLAQRRVSNGVGDGSACARVMAPNTAPSTSP